MKQLNRIMGWLRRLVLAAAVGMALPAGAAVYTFDFNSGLPNGGVVPDGNPTGWSDTRNVDWNGQAGSGAWNITDVNVILNVSGGYNGDLYAYLVHGSGFAVLLNRVGTGTGSGPTYTFGFPTSGFNNVTLDDSAGTGIHFVQNPMPGSSYFSDGGTLSSFNTLDPNGNWTLFFADMASGDQSMVTDWSLEITAVPEPIGPALGVFAMGGLFFAFGRRFRRFVI